MKLKLLFITIAIILIFTGCSNASDNLNQNEIQTSLKTEIMTLISTQKPTEEVKTEAIATDTQAPALVDTERRVDSIGPSSYEELANLTGEKRSKAMSYNMEHCYFKMNNIPEDYEKVYVSIWEIGFFADYKNPKTNERIEFNWWTNRKLEDYKISIQDVRNLKIISKNGIDYYCSFVTIEKEPTDKTEPSETPHHAAIRWIEDGKCFYIQVISATSLDESVLKYCDLEKFTIE